MKAKASRQKDAAVEEKDGPADNSKTLHFLSHLSWNHVCLLKRGKSLVFTEPEPDRDGTLGKFKCDKTGAQFNAYIFMLRYEHQSAVWAWPLDNQLHPIGTVCDQAYWFAERLLFPNDAMMEIQRKFDQTNFVVPGEKSNGLTKHCEMLPTASVPDLNLTWGLELALTPESQFVPINEKCVRRDPHFPPQLYLVSYADQGNSKTLGTIAQSMPKAGQQAALLNPIFKKGIPSVPRMAWFCIDEIESKLFLVFGQADKKFYLKQIGLKFGDLDGMGSRLVTVVDDSQAMLKIDLRQTPIPEPECVLPFLSPNHPTLLFYAYRVQVLSVSEVQFVDKRKSRTQFNFIGSLEIETVSRKQRCRAKSHDRFVSWTSPFDLVFSHNGTRLAVFAIPIDSCYHSIRTSYHKDMREENEGIGLSSVWVYDVTAEPQLTLTLHDPKNFLSEAKRSDVKYGQIELLKSLVPSGVEYVPHPSDLVGDDMVPECFATNMTFWGRVFKYGIILFHNKGVLAVKNFHNTLLIEWGRRAMDTYVPVQLAQQNTFFIDFLSNTFFGPDHSKAALPSEGFLVNLVGKMGPMLYFRRTHFEFSEMTIRQMDMGIVCKDYRVCAYCSATETKKRRNAKGKRMASFKVCRYCKRKGFHANWRKHPCYFCSDQCMRSGWKEHKKIHAIKIKP